MNGPHGADELVDAYGRKYLTVEERARFLAAVRVHRQPAVQTLTCTLASSALPTVAPVFGHDDLATTVIGAHVIPTPTTLTRALRCFFALFCNRSDRSVTEQGRRATETLRHTLRERQN